MPKLGGLLLMAFVVFQGCSSYLKLEVQSKYKEPVRILIYDIEDNSGGFYGGANRAPEISIRLRNAFINFNSRYVAALGDRYGDTIMCQGSQGFTVIAREQMERILQENKIQTSGLTEQNNILQMGKLANSRIALLSTVHSDGKLQCRVLDLETGVYTMSFSYVIGSQDLFGGLSVDEDALKNMSVIPLYVLSPSGVVDYYKYGISW